MSDRISIGLPSMREEPGEKRVFLPDFIQRLTDIGFEVFLEEGYGNPLDFYFDDYELWLRISERYELKHVNQVLVDKYVEEPPFIVRAFTKGLRILRHGRHTPVG